MATYRQPFKKEWPITQMYGEKITSSFHTGIDYGCPLNTPILASSDGTVMFAAWDTTGYGNMVIVMHMMSVSTLYAHLSDISVKVGQKVRQGELLGHSGTTGNSTGPHLHFEARHQWDDYKSHFDPMKLPLTMVDDSIPVNKPQLFGPEELGSDVVVDCPAGVYCHNLTFTGKGKVPKGTKLTYLGETTENNGLTFCKCTFRVDPFWVAVNDGETQILVNDD